MSGSAQNRIVVPVFFDRSALLQGAGHRTVVVLEPLVAVAQDGGLEPGRQRVDHRDADAVQTTADVVAAVLAAELAAGVQLRHDDVDGRDAGGVHGDGDAAAVVGDLDAAVAEDLDVDPGGVAGHRLVDRVVDDLPHQVVQAALAGGADVHARTFADGLQTLENGDRFGAVLVGSILLLGSHVERVSLGFAMRQGSKRPSRICFESTVTHRQH